MWKYKIDWVKCCNTLRVVGGAIVVACVIGGIIEGKDWKLAMYGAALGFVLILITSITPSEDKTMDAGLVAILTVVALVIPLILYRIYTGE